MKRACLRAISAPSLSALLRTPVADAKMAELRPRLRGFFAAKGLTRDDVEDLVQDTLLRLLRWPPPERLVEQAAFRAAETALISHWRRKPPAPLLELHENSEAFEGPDPTEGWILEADLHQALMAMPPFHRDVILLSAEGYTEEEISGILEASPRRVGRTLRRVRLKLSRWGRGEG